MDERHTLHNALRGLTESPPERPDGEPVSEHRVRLDQWAFGPAGEEPRRRAPRRRIPVSLVVVGALALGAVGYFFTRPGGPTGPPLALAMDFREGHVHRYQLHMKMTGSVTAAGETQPLDIDANMTFGMKVLSVDKKGVAVVAVVPGGISGTVNGETIPQEELPGRTRLRIARDGRILSGGDAFMAGSGEGVNTNVPALDQFTPLLPEHPVQPGDEWDKNFSRPFPLGAGKLEFTAHNQFLRYEDLAGARTAVLQTDISVPLDFTVEVKRLLAKLGLSEADAQIPAGADPRLVYGGTMDGTMTSWFDPKTGQQLKGIGDMDFDMSLRVEGLPQDDGASDMAFSGSFDFELFRLS